MLVDSPGGFLRVSIGVVVPAAGVTAVIAIFLVGNVVRAHRARVRTGFEGLMGQDAVAVEDFERGPGGFHGRVRIHGEYWNATCARPVTTGEAVEVEGRRELTLRVKSKDTRTMST